LLAKPFWIWGAEMGANQHGVVIGNEAVFTRMPYEKGPGLIGMDLIRLALERAATARAALDVLTGLLETHGQGGNCGLARPLFYHNSFLLADLQEAWVLETAGRQWAAERVQDVRSISNAITIGTRWDLASEGLVDYAVDQGWCRKRGEFHFGRCYSDFLYTRFSAARARQCRSTELLERRKGRLTVADMVGMLRDHGPKAGPDWTPSRGLTGADICMHAGFGPVRRSQSTGSLVSHMRADGQTHWVTATSAPCTGVFKPIWLDAGMPETGPAPTATYDEATLWWRHEALHRALLRDYAVRLPLYASERDQLEAGFLAAEEDCRHVSAPERLSFSRRCFDQAADATVRWTKAVQAMPVDTGMPWLYERAWHGRNREAGMPSRA
jgi:secernin